MEPRPLNDLLKDDLEPCPCTDCRLRSRCARERLACAAYGAFHDGRSWQEELREPSSATFAELFERRRRRTKGRSAA